MVLLLLGATVLPGTATSATATGFDDSHCRVTGISFSVSGAPAPLVAVGRGDHVAVTFEVPPGCVNRMTFASYVAPAPAFDGSKLDEQVVFDKAGDAFGAGRHSMELDVFDFPGSNIPDCTAGPSVPLSSKQHDDHAIVRVDEAANPSGLFDGTCAGSPSQNGTASGGVGKPCAGCVGNADGKNPPGQQPGGSDHDAGYKCDRNQGIGQTNPAHSGCQNFQVDFSYRPSPGDAGSLHGHGPELIAAVFCVRASQVCYTTDRTDSGAVLGS
jgi:hypothetical protein